jgi:exonuclease VII large subunit
MAEVRQQLKEYEDRMHNAAMANMDEQEKIAYELEVERNRRARIEQELQQERQRAEQTSMMNQYAQGFTELGVSYEELDFTDVNALWASGWEGVKRSRAELLERVKKLEAADAGPAQSEPTQKSNAPKAPQVMTQHGSQPSDTRTIGDVIQALRTQYPNQEWTEDKVVTQVERGQLPRTILEGIDWSK